VGILPLASPPAIDNAGDESAHFRNGMRRASLESPRRSRALRCMACEFARLRGPTWRMLDPSSSPSATAQAKTDEEKQLLLELLCTWTAAAVAADAIPIAKPPQHSGR
jgi:hypothetical protein